MKEFSVNSIYIGADILEEALIKYVHLLSDDREDESFQFHPITIRENGNILWHIDDPEFLQETLMKMSFGIRVELKQ